MGTRRELAEPFESRDELAAALRAEGLAVGEWTPVPADVDPTLRATAEWVLRTDS